MKFLCLFPFHIPVYDMYQNKHLHRSKKSKCYCFHFRCFNPPSNLLVPTVEGRRLFFFLCHLRGDELLRAVPLLYSTKNAAGNVQDAHDGSNNRVCDDKPLRSAGKLKPQPSVDDADDDEDSAVPNVGVADESSLLVLDKIFVMRPSENWLQTNHGADHSSHLGVCVVKPLEGVC